MIYCISPDKKEGPATHGKFVLKDFVRLHSDIQTPAISTVHAVRERAVSTRTRWCVRLDARCGFSDLSASVGHEFVQLDAPSYINHDDGSSHLRERAVNCRVEKSK